MTLTDALKIAAQAKPIRRQPLDKLHGSTTTTDVSASVSALLKSYAAIGGTAVEIQKRLDQLAADVEFVQDFQPGQPVRRIHS